MLAEPTISPLFGRTNPRVCPPAPLRHNAADFHDQAVDIGIDPYPWQDVAAQYIEALDADDRHLYPEVAVIVSRQNGKTELLVPYIVKEVRAGRRIMHSAQNRELPREVFKRVAGIMVAKYPSELARQPRFANGQEEIETTNGGSYRIVAPTRGGARGPSNDILIVDELREMDTTDFIAAAKPTLMASRDPQTLYLSNAGTDESVVLNALRARSTEDPSLAYLEWSASPERSADDVDGWLEGNPSAGHAPQVMGNLEREYRANKLAGTLAIFETEHLCRWVVTMRQRLIDESSWLLGHRDDLAIPRRICLAVSMDPGGRRSAAAVAWQSPDGQVGLRLLFDVTGDPIDPDLLGADIVKRVRRMGVVKMGYDPLTDAELAKHFKKPERLSGQVFANASAHFVNLVRAGRLVWSDADQVTDDLVWTSRKSHDATGSYQAVRANDDRPIPAALASIRAVWLASGPRLQSRPRVG